LYDRLYCEIPREQRSRKGSRTMFAETLVVHTENRAMTSGQALPIGFTRKEGNRETQWMESNSPWLITSGPGNNHCFQLHLPRTERLGGPRSERCAPIGFSLILWVHCRIPIRKDQSFFCEADIFVWYEERRFCSPDGNSRDSVRICLPPRSSTGGP
jgi:hypothetical protein